MTLSLESDNVFVEEDIMRDIFSLGLYISLFLFEYRSHVESWCNF